MNLFNYNPGIEETPNEYNNNGEITDVGHLLADGIISKRNLEGKLKTEKLFEKLKYFLVQAEFYGSHINNFNREFIINLLEDTEVHINDYNRYFTLNSIKNPFENHLVNQNEQRKKDSYLEKDLDSYVDDGHLHNVLLDKYLNVNKMISEYQKNKIS